MCGIAGVYLRDPSAKADLDGMLDTMLDCIEHRGGDATGFVALDAKGIAEWQKAACSSKDFCRYRRPVPKGTRTILAHTRWATLGLPAFVENNHPLKRGAFVAIHNGHVSNHSKIFALAGRTPYGQVDSECIPARFASLGSLAAAPKVMREIQGAAAIAAVDERNPGELLLAKGHQSPLFVLQTKKYVLWGSTRRTIEEAYVKHIGALPRKAKIVSLSPGVALHFVDGKVTKLTFKPYAPPKVTYAASTAWKETSTEVSKIYSVDDWKEATVRILQDEDRIDCDLCGESTPWRDVDYVNDSDGYTWHICGRCDPDAITGDIVSDEVAIVNAVILDEDVD